jgi:endoglucanase
MKTEKNLMVLALTSVSLAVIGAACIAPQPGTGPGAAPGSAASIGAGAGAAPSSAASAFKDCGPEGMIDDGEDGNNMNMPLANRGGYWYTFVDKAGSTVSPTAGEQGGTFAMAEGGANNSKFAANVKGKIATGAIVFGAMGMNFVDPKDQYDASKYAGVSFFAKRGPNSTGKVRLKVPDESTDPEGKICTECFNDFGADMTFQEQWTKIIVPFKKMSQLTGWGSPRRAKINPKTIYGLQFQVNVPGANYDIWVDDLQFICE